MLLASFTQMKGISRAVTLSLCLALLSLDGGSLHAQDAPDTSAPPSPAPDKPVPSREDLEAKFKATLTKATFTGRWAGIKDGKLGPEKSDSYTISGVTKIGGESWIIFARIQYGERDFTAPIPVRVKWAGDTPVITLDDVGLPGGNSYSARVLVYDNTYAGTWSGGGHAGLLNGIIVKADDTK